MAELCGVLLAVPGVIDVIISSGEAMHMKINTYRQMDENLARYRELALEIQEGSVRFAFDFLKTASMDQSIPIYIHQTLEKVLQEIKADLELVLTNLNDVADASRRVRRARIRYTFQKGTGSKDWFENRFKIIKDRCKAINDLCLQIHAFRSAPSSALLTVDIFKVIHETHAYRPGRNLPNSDIFIALCSYKRCNNPIVAELILEKKTCENDVRFLTTEILSKEALVNKNGILPALGYRQPPYNEPGRTAAFQIVFELPQEKAKRESLAHWICSEPCPDLKQRLKLCLKLSRVVETIHSMGLVHKSLRPRAILMLSNGRLGDPTAEMYVQDWTLVRKLDDVSARLGEDSWPKNIYKHPERQGICLETTYTLKHDMYSLGVCMLEILLWTPFVTELEGGGGFKILDLFESIGLAAGEENGGLPPRYAGNSAKLASRPWVTKAIWCEMVHQAMGDGTLAWLIRDCLEGTHEAVSIVVKALQARIKLL